MPDLQEKTSRQKLWHELDQMKLDEKRYFRYPDMRYTHIERSIRSYSKKYHVSFKIEADYEKGLGATRIIGRLPRTNWEK